MFLDALVDPEHEATMHAVDKHAILAPKRGLQQSCMSQTFLGTSSICNRAGDYYVSYTDVPHLLNCLRQHDILQHGVLLSNAGL